MVFSTPLKTFYLILVLLGFMTISSCSPIPCQISSQVLKEKESISLNITEYTFKDQYKEEMLYQLFKKILPAYYYLFERDSLGEKLLI